MTSPGPGNDRRQRLRSPLSVQLDGRGARGVDREPRDDCRGDVGEREQDPIPGADAAGRKVTGERSNARRELAVREAEAGRRDSGRIGPSRGVFEDPVMWKW